MVGMKIKYSIELILHEGITRLGINKKKVYFFSMPRKASIFLTKCDQMFSPVISLMFSNTLFNSTRQI